jgi:putative phosphotransacetylase
MFFPGKQSGKKDMMGTAIMINHKGIESYLGQRSFSNKQAVCSTAENLVSVLADEIAESFGSLVQEMRGKSLKTTCGALTIPVGISNRHIHLTTQTFGRLFGMETRFEVERPLYQPGEFVSRHVLSVAGPKMRALQNVRILGPLRKYDQVELSLTEAVGLGIEPPVRNSGDLNDSVPLTLIGPRGSVYLERCAIIANRHIHMSSSDASSFGVSDGDLCRVRVRSEKSTTFEDVLVRVNNSWKLVIHLDTDDANAACIRKSANAEFCGKM